MGGAGGNRGERGEQRCPPLGRTFPAGAGLYRSSSLRPAAFRRDAVRGAGGRYIAVAFKGLRVLLGERSRPSVFLRLPKVAGDKGKPRLLKFEGPRRISGLAAASLLFGQQKQPSAAAVPVCHSDAGDSGFFKEKLQCSVHVELVSTETD